MRTGAPAQPRQREGEWKKGLAANQMAGRSGSMGNLTVPVAPPLPIKKKTATVIEVEQVQKGEPPPRTPQSGTFIPGNPYVQISPLPVSPAAGSVETMRKAFSRCGKKLEDNTRRAGVLAENVWRHWTMGPNFGDTVMAKITHGTKLIAEGGHERVFHQVFGAFPGEKLRKAYACYLSTSSGPVIGTLYLSNSRIAFCSDNAIHAATNSSGKQEWAYYKVVIQLNKLKEVNPDGGKPSINAEKYIQILTKDGLEFWFMGFVYYEEALANLKEAV